MKQGIKMDKIFVFDFIRLNTQIITQQHSLVTSHSSSQWLEALIPIHHELCVAPPFALFAQQHNIVELVCLTYNCKSVARETSLSQIKVGPKHLKCCRKVTPIASTSKFSMLTVEGPIKKWFHYHPIWHMYLSSHSQIHSNPSNYKTD